MKENASVVTIAEVTDRRRLRDWLKVPFIVFEGDPLWTPQLDFMEKRRISPKHAPFFTFGEAAFFVAYRNNEPVGRISAQINRRHLDRYRDDTGHFGFFDCLNDKEAAGKLVATAADWLRSRGMKRMLGPVSLSLNEETGCLVDGFDTIEALMMPRARQWTGPLLESTGLQKEMDVYAYRFVRGAKVPDKILRLAAGERDTQRIGYRPFDVKRYDEEVRRVFDIANQAWAANWGFVPFSDAEIKAVASEMKPLITDDFGGFAVFEGREVGFIIGVPNLNEAIAGFGGKLLPFNWLKLLRTIRARRFKTFRVPLMGMLPEFQSTPRGGAVLGFLFGKFSDHVARFDPDWSEMSWILDNNPRMKRLAQMIGGPPPKTYRLYAKPI
ncbi:MAG: hypothetical protein AB7E69_16405 [Sphingomonadales bacterium]